MADLNSQIKEMQQKGMDSSKIIDELKNQGHSSQDIYSSMEPGNESTGAPLEAPSPSQGVETTGDEGFTTSALSSPTEGEQPEMPQPGLETPMPMGGTPMPQQQRIPQRQNIEQIEEISEAIVDEKIQEFSSMIGDMNVWKERTTSEMEAIKQEILRLRNHLENLQVSISGKVEVYNKSVTTMSAEMKALSKVMEKIMLPLSTNVKELSRITNKFKQIK